MLDSCEQVKSNFEGVYNKLNNALKGPGKLLGMLDKQANKLTNLASFDVSNLVPNIPEPSGGVNISELESLMSCSYIADSALGGSIASILDAVDAGEAIPGSALDSLRSGVQGAINGAIDGALKNSPLGKVNDLANMYSSALNKINTSEAFGHLNTLRQCIESICGSAEGFEYRIEQAKESARISPVDDTPEDPILSASNVSEDIKSQYNSKINDINNVKEEVKGLTF